MKIMNINNFEDYFDNVILKRGLDYYKSGNVVSLEQELGDGQWVAEVDGSENYTVTVTISDKGEITDTDCDCPYDMNIHCKHQAAVFYALREEPQKSPKSKSSKKKNLEALLNSLAKPALVSLLLEFSKNDKRIKEEILLRYADKYDILESARNVIRGSIKAVKHRGYVEYHDVRKAAKGAKITFELAEDKLSSGEILISLNLCVIILEETMDLIDCCYDSATEAWNIIGATTELIKKAVLAVCESGKNSEKYFELIFGYAINSKHDYRSDLLHSVIPLCNNKTNRNKIERYIYEAAKPKTDDYRYSNQWHQRLQLEIIQQFDGKSATNDYIEKHIDTNDEFRKIAVNNAISAKQYEKALKLCLDGEEKSPSHKGLCQQWQELRYSVYEKTNNNPAQIMLATEFVLDGNFDYFLKLKKLHNKNEWNSVVQNLLEEIGNNSHYGIYVKILIEEKLKLRLLEYCKNYSSTITEYYVHLLPECKIDVGVLFEQCIRRDAESASDRSSYRKVCGIIRHYKKACGSESAFSIRDELKIKYAKRPAFLDELGKVK